MKFFRRGQWDDERARELEAYLQMETDENVARGMSAADARLAARRKLGPVARIREDIYDMNSVRFLETAWRDLRHGARLLRRSPGFAAVAILSLALGIGANAAIFQLLNAVRLRPLPVPAPQELAEVLIAGSASRSGSFVGRHVQFTHPLWNRIRSDQQVFSGMFTWGIGRFNLAPGGAVRPADGVWVSGDYFNVLGVRPFEGRLLTGADDQPGCASPVAVISYPFWQREYGGDRSIVGKTVSLNGHAFDVVGIAPPEFFGMEMGRSFDVAVPLCSEPLLRAEDSAIGNSAFWWLAIAGRLKPGVSLAQADAQMRVLSAGVFKETLPKTYPPDQATRYLAYQLSAVSASSGVESLKQYDAPMWVLLAITGAVLLIACANLANLMLARASAREREIAVRLAIGASRGRVIRQLVAESLLLAVIGAALGGWLARSLSQLLVRFLSSAGDRLAVDLGTDWRVLAFMAGLACLTCLLFGVVPAFRATRTSPGAAMKSAGRASTEGRERLSLRRALVVVQVALSLVLVVGALLFAQSFQNLTRLDAGFRQDGLLVARLDFRNLRVPVERRLALYDDVLTRLRSTSGVESATAVYIVPVSGSGWNERIKMPGRPGDKAPLSDFNRVSPGFFKTMGTTVLAGRDFDEHDTRSAPLVAIVTEAFAKAVFQRSNVVGERFQIDVWPGEPERTYQIVGVARDMRYKDIRNAFAPIVYLPIQQDEEPPPDPSVLVRSTASIEAATAEVTSALRAVSPVISVRFTPVPSQIRASLLRERVMATLSGFFGVLAALLAMIGLYGVMSYMVARRRNEIGIRIALGADAKTVVAMIVGESARLVAIGIVAGAVLAVAGAKAATSLLFGVTPADPSTLAIAFAAMITVALLASALPAIRAATLDPTVALRDE